MSQRTEPAILVDFMTAANAAEGAASQLVTTMSNPKFMAVRDMLNIIKNGCLARASLHTGVQ